MNKNKQKNPILDVKLVNKCPEVHYQQGLNPASELEAMFWKWSIG